MVRPLTAWVLGILAALCAAREAPAAMYYVSTTGKDSNPGTAAEPWKTLQNAVNHVQAGDTVNVAAGDYAGFVDGWDSVISGTPSAPITFNAAPGTVINAPDQYTADGIDLEPGCNYIVIEGFSIQNPASDTISRAGIRVTGSNNVVVQDNVANNCGTWGIFTAFANNVLVQGNTASNSQQQHGIYISNATVGPIVRGNTVFGNAECGIQFNGDLSEGGTGMISNAVVEQNIVYDNGAAGGAAINCDGLENSIIANNLLFGNQSSGVALFHQDAAAGSTNNQVVNNTIINAANARSVININSSSTGNTLRNNVLFDLNPSSLVGAITITSDSLSGFVSDDNLVDPRFLVDGTNETLSQWQAATGNDTHSAPTTYAAGALTVGNSGDSTFGGTIQNITGPLALDKIGAGSLLLSGTNTYSGGTTVSDGTLDVTNSDALPAGSSLTVGAGGTLVFDSTAATSPTRAVPEPGTLALLTVAAFATAICRCIQSRRKKPNGPPSRPLLLAPPPAPFSTVPSIIFRAGF